MNFLDPSSPCTAAESGLSGHHPPSGSFASAARSSINSSRPATEHSYCLTSRNKSPWLTLSVTSASSNATQLPNIFEGDTISGRVQATLEHDDSIKSISVMVLGQMIMSASDVYNFLEISTELWTSSKANPTPNTPAKSDGKLRGSHEWPFSLKIPRFVNLRFAGREPKEYRLPPSFSERLARVHIQYQLIALARRGRFRSNSRIMTVFSYTPLIKPDPPSVLRQAAYRDRMPLVGPAGDPEGWHSLPPVTTRGLAFGSHEVDVRLTLWLATPLCYTRDSVIPCFLLIESEDAPTLNSLVTPENIHVRLTRHLQPGVHGSAPTASAVAGAGGDPNSQDIAPATWWPSAHGMLAGACQRALEGEIALAASLKPSCWLGEFALSYSVALYPPRTPSFVPGGGGAGAPCSAVVEIATAYAVGPRPVAYSPPRHADNPESSRRA